MSRSIFVVLVAVLLQGSLSHAQDLPWTSMDHVTDRPSLGYSPALIPDPADASGESWYAFTPGYLWHASDLGRVVREVSEIGRDNLMVSGLSVAHQAPHVLYVATGVNQYDEAGSHGTFFSELNREVTRFEGSGVYRSVDGGETWTRLPFFQGTDAGRDLRVLNSITTSAEGDTVMVTTASRILRSVDAGQTWSVVHELHLPTINPFYRDDHPPFISQARLYHHPGSLRNVFVTAYGNSASTGAGLDPHYVLASHDGGDTWELLTMDGRPLTQTQTERFRDWLLAGDPKDPNIFWAQVVRQPPTRGDLSERKLFRSGDGGQNWVDVPVVQKPGSGWWAGDKAAPSLHVHPTAGDSVILGYSVGHYQDDQLVTFGQQGNSHIHFLTPSSTHRGFRYILREGNVVEGILYAWKPIWTVNEAGAARAIFTGELPRDPYIADVCTMPVPAGWDSSHRYVVSRSANGTSGWRMQTGTGKTSRHEVHSTPTSLTTPVPGTTSTLFPYATFHNRRLHCHPDRWDVLIGGENSWGGTSAPGEVNFRRLAHADSIARTKFRASQISASRQRPDRVWVARGDGTLSRIDGYDELSWIMPEVRDSTAHPYSILRRTGTAVHAHDADADVVYTARHVSKDGGFSWTARETPDSLQFHHRDRVVSHPEDPAVIYACTSRGLDRWEDYLQDHTLLADAADYGYCRDVMVFFHDPKRMWMGTDKGLFESLDEGETWSRQNRGLPNVPITRINLSHDWEEILVATFGRGLFTVRATDVDMTLVSTTPDAEIPESGALLSNYPNPFVDETQLLFTTEKPGHVRMEVFNVLGRQVATATDQLYGSGSHQVRFSGAGLTGGVYLVRLQVDGRQVAVQKMVRR